MKTNIVNRVYCDKLDEEILVKIKDSAVSQYTVVVKPGEIVLETLYGITSNKVTMGAIIKCNHSLMWKLTTKAIQSITFTFNIIYVDSISVTS